MADTKITALTEDTAPDSADLVATVDDPAGTPVNKKATIANLSKGINASNIATGTLAVAQGGTGATTLTGILEGNGTSAISAITDGTANQVLTTDGAGAYSFETVSAGSVDAVTITVRKGSVGTLTKGVPVYLSGYNASGYYEVEQADSNDPTKMPSIGIVGENVTNGANSTLTIFGTLTGMDTSAFSVGDALYVQADGTVGSTRPANADDGVQKVGVVVRSNVSNGVIAIAGAFRSNDIPNRMSDATFRIVDDGDVTKAIMFQASGITTATTRTLTIQDADGTIAYSADIPTTATTSAEGIVELATTAEIDTGTDTSRVPSVDALAGSYAGTKVLEVTAFDYATDTAVGDGAGYVTVPDSYGGMNLVGVHARVITAGTTGTTDVQIHNLTQTADMLTTKITIDSAETGSDTAAAAAAIDAANDDVAAWDLLRIDVDAVSTTAAKGLIVTMEFRLP